MVWLVNTGPGFHNFIFVSHSVLLLLMLDWALEKVLCSLIFFLESRHMRENLKQTEY